MDVILAYLNNKLKEKINYFNIVKNMDIPLKHKDKILYLLYTSNCLHVIYDNDLMLALIIYIDALLIRGKNFEIFVIDDNEL